MRRCAFRPTGPDPLEGRLAPAAVSGLGHSAAQVSHALANVPTQTTVYASNADSPAALAAKAARTAHAKAVARANPHSNSINWKKVGDQVTSFLGFGHKSKPHAVARSTTSGHTLLRN
ncbi:MAG TPA: hypothetical protein VGH33_03275 [Isosphaeraceae bacterium]|jgi:hypothetical protein